jgi:Fur family ferric uptake transcriptional regulator/Fur family zinc uptake transcriptional regulator
MIQGRGKVINTQIFESRKIFDSRFILGVIETEKNKGTAEAVKLGALLKSAGLKVTPPRLDVLKHLTEARRPMSHSELQDALPEMDRVTLYRTLFAFVEADIAHQVQGLDGTWRFCAHLRGTEGCPGNHPHFLCVSCGMMMCLTDQELPRVQIPGGYTVQGKQLVAYGKCPDCTRKETAEKCG